MKETQQDAAKSQLRAGQFFSHYSNDLFMFATTFVLNFTADKHSGNVFMDDNKSVVLSVPLHVHFPPICSSSCDLLCCAASLVPQLPSTGMRLNGSSSVMWHWVSNYVLTEFLLVLICGEVSGTRKRSELLFLTVSCWTGSQPCWWGCNGRKHTSIQLFLAAGFRIPVWQSSLQWNVLWHLSRFFSRGGRFFGKRPFNHIV